MVVRLVVKMAESKVDWSADCLVAKMVEMKVVRMVARWVAQWAVLLVGCWVVMSAVWKVVRMVEY